jgi:hypothetical protein
MTTSDRTEKSEAVATEGKAGLSERFSMGAALVRDGASEVSQEVRSAAAGAGEAGRAALDRARDATGRLRSMVEAQTQRLQGGYRTILNEHPLVIAAVGFGLGAILATCLPRTRREVEVLGGASERARRAVQTGLGTAAERATTLAREQVESIGKSEAGNGGGTSGRDRFS